MSEEKKEVETQELTDIQKVALLSADYVNYIFTDIKKNAEMLNDIPAPDVLTQIGTTILGNLLLAFVSEELENPERLAACKVLLQGIGGQVQNNLERILSDKVKIAIPSTEIIKPATH